MPHRKPEKRPSRVAFVPKQVSLELTTKHTHRIFTIRRPVVKFVDLKENPDRVAIGSMERGYVRVFAYRSNPERCFISVGDEILALDTFNFPKMVSLLAKSAWFCGFYGKRARKWKYNRVKRV